MRLERLSPNLYYFLSGVLVSGGVNLLTGLTSDGSRLPSGLVVLCAGGWIIGAALLAYVGGLLEDTRSQSLTLEAPTLSAAEKLAIRHSTMAKVSKKVTGSLVLTGLIIAASALLLWWGAA